MQDVTTDQVALARSDIPEPVVAALGDWLKQMAHEAGAGTRSALAQSEGDLGAARSELDALTARLAARDEEIEQLNAELRNARHIATDALVGKAKDQLAIEGKDSQLADLRAQIERNVAASAALSDARLAAEMELVGAVTARDNYAAEIRELRAKLAARAG
jgi:chromosome segregation ATPase